MRQYAPQTHQQIIDLQFFRASDVNSAVIFHGDIR